MLAPLHKHPACISWCRARHAPLRNAGSNLSMLIGRSRPSSSRSHGEVIGLGSIPSAVMDLLRAWGYRGSWPAVGWGARRTGSGMKPAMVQRQKGHRGGFLWNSHSLVAQGRHRRCLQGPRPTCARGRDLSAG